MSSDFNFSLDEDTQFTQILNTQGLVLPSLEVLWFCPFFLLFQVYRCTQWARKVLSCNPWLVGFPLGLVDFIHHLLKKQVKNFHFPVCNWGKADSLEKWKRLQLAQRLSWKINFLCTLCTSFCFGSKFHYWMALMKKSPLVLCLLWRCYNFLHASLHIEV